MASTTALNRNAGRKHINALIDNGDTIEIVALDPFDCVATAADTSNTVAMLVRRDNETLKTLLNLLDKAINRAYSSGDFTDEVNSADN